MDVVAIKSSELSTETARQVFNYSQEKRVLALSLGLRCVEELERQGLLPAAEQKDGNGGIVAAASLGQQAEDEVYGLLSGPYDTRDVTKKAHATDFVIASRAGAVRVEVKNYSATVPSREVEKFLRDLGESGAAAGVLFSLGSAIAGIRSSVEVRVEAVSEAKSFLPVIYASPPRDSAAAGDRLHHDVMRAAIDIAISLAKVYPRSVAGLHRTDTLLHQVTLLEEAMASIGGVGTDIDTLSASFAGELVRIRSRLQSAIHSARETVRAQRNEIETPLDVKPCVLWQNLEEKGYHFCAQKSLVRQITDLLDGHYSAPESERVWSSSEHPFGWRLLKSKIIHVATGCGLCFLKSRTDFQLPFSRVGPERCAALLHQLGSKIRIADKTVSVQVDDDTLSCVSSLIAAGPKPQAHPDPQ